MEGKGVKKAMNFPIDELQEKRRFKYYLVIPVGSDGLYRLEPCRSLNTLVRKRGEIDGDVLIMKQIDVKVIAEEVEI